jgi:hypothetical protein
MTVVDSSGIQLSCAAVAGRPDGLIEGGRRMLTTNLASSRLTCLLAALVGSFVLSTVPPARAQHACTTNYCVKSQSISFQTPPSWPSVTIETCCRTLWGALPDGLDWTNGVPIMICTGNAEYAATYPNCGDPKNLSQDFPLNYENPKIGIGVAWPNAKEYRYRVESIPIVDGEDGTCAQYSNAPGKVTNWWIYELKEPKRGSYVFAAALTFRQGEKGYYAVLNNCTFAPPPSTAPGR